MKTLSQVAKSSQYSIEVRDNCLWALAYSMKETQEKTSIDSELIDTLGDLRTVPEENVKKTAAIALCYYAADEKTTLSDHVLKRSAVMSIERIRAC